MTSFTAALALSLLATLCIPLEVADAQQSAAAQFYVATNGNDTWSGTLPAPNVANTDGPFASLVRARDAVRALKAKAAPTGGIRVLVRGGTHFLSEPAAFGPEDSGTAECPLTYAAYPGEAPVLSGGRLLTNWRRAGRLAAADVPGVKEGKWGFRQLFVGEERQTRARTPNFDPEHPYTGGWYFVSELPKPDGQKGAFGDSLVRIHSAGDTFAWDVEVRAAGEYRLWLYYGALNKAFGREDMAGQTTMQVDDEEAVTLQNLPDTGGWETFKWSQTAALSLTPGKHRLRWTNVKGGGLNFDAFALCDDADWQPEGAELVDPAAGKHVVVVQAEAYDEGKGRESGVSKNRVPAQKDRFCFRLGDFAHWPRSPEPEIHIFPAWGWVNALLSVDRIDFENNLVYVKNRNCTQELRLGNRYFVENVFEALDSPGEWFLDREQGKVYYWPTSDDFEKQGVVAPVLDRLIDIRGDIEGEEEGAIDATVAAAATAGDRRFVEHLTFRGLTFAHTTYSLEMASPYTPDDGTVWMRRARHCTVEDCKFPGVGGYAVRLSLHSSDNRIVRNTVTDGGQGGVLLTGYLTATQAHDNLVAGNTITQCGKLWKHVAGVYVTTGSGNRIAHNTITDMPRYGVSLKSFRAGSASHNNVVEYNRILRTNLETNDTGAIETLGRDRENSGNVIRYNLILDVVRLKTSETGEMLTPYYTWGIYLDDYSSGTQIVGNIVARTVRGAGHVHLGRNNVWENNVFVDGAERQFECNGDADMGDNTFVRNIVVWREGSLMRISGGGGNCLRKCDNNLYWRAGQDLDSTEGLTEALTPKGTWAQWLEAGYEAHSVVADPLFVEAAHDDYRLEPESPALKLGFKPIDVSRIGAQGWGD